MPSVVGVPAPVAVVFQVGGARTRLLPLMPSMVGVPASVAVVFQVDGAPTLLGCLLAWRVLPLSVPGAGRPLIGACGTQGPPRVASAASAASAASTSGVDGQVVRLHLGCGLRRHPPVVRRPAQVHVFARGSRRLALLSLPPPELLAELLLVPTVLPLPELLLVVRRGPGDGRGLGLRRRARAGPAAAAAHLSLGAAGVPPGGAAGL
mmetsp:Transcript_68138/g.211687  ORF Transcript_68138/g.211687 Transcript_68138/m.211687 type:complete len:207 (+) Transcript_68138:1292-1912(+)